MRFITRHNESRDQRVELIRGGKNIFTVVKATFRGENLIKNMECKHVKNLVVCYDVRSL